MSAGPYSLVLRQESADEDSCFLKLSIHKAPDAFCLVQDRYCSPEASPMRLFTHDFLP
jgi:hypothetical protein